VSTGRHTVETSLSMQLVALVESSTPTTSLRKCTETMEYVETCLRACRLVLVNQCVIYENLNLNQQSSYLEDLLKCVVLSTLNMEQF